MNRTEGTEQKKQKRGTEQQEKIRRNITERTAQKEQHRKNSTKETEQKEQNRGNSTE